MTMNEIKLPLEVPILGKPEDKLIPPVLMGIDLTDEQRLLMYLDLYKFEAQLKMQVLAGVNGNITSAKACFHWISEGRPNVA
jgi:hypothetical protein